MTNDTVLTAAHLVIGRDDIHVRFGFDSTEWIAPAVAAAVDETVDVESSVPTQVMRQSLPRPDTAKSRPGRPSSR